MTEQEHYDTADGNALIGKFMGYEVKRIAGQGDVAWVYKKRVFNDSRYHIVSDDFNMQAYLLTLSKEELDKLTEVKWCLVDELNYHRSLDALLPVLDRIKKVMGSLVIEMGIMKPDNDDREYHCKISVSDGNLQNFFAHRKRNLPDAVSGAIVDFLKWYNNKST